MRKGHTSERDRGLAFQSLCSIISTSQSIIGGYQGPDSPSVLGPGRQQHALNEYLDELMRAQAEQERLDEAQS